MERYGIRMTLTGGETADVGDLVRTVIVDSTVCARVRRSDIIDNSRISAGDVIVGLASFGYRQQRPHLGPPRPLRPLSGGQVSGKL